MKTIQGFTPFTKIETVGFAKFGIFMHCGYEVSRFKGKIEKGFRYDTEAIFITRYSKDEFPSLIEFKCNTCTFCQTSENRSLHTIELDKPERLNQFSEKFRHRVLSILN